MKRIFVVFSQAIGTFLLFMKCDGIAQRLIKCNNAYGDDLANAGHTVCDGEEATRRKFVIKCEIEIAGIFLLAKFNIFAAVCTKQRKARVARALVASA